VGGSHKSIHLTVSGVTKQIELEDHCSRLFKLMEGNEPESIDNKKFYIQYAGTQKHLQNGIDIGDNKKKAHIIQNYHVFRSHFLVIFLHQCKS
jgi:hypothetical protein